MARVLIVGSAPELARELEAEGHLVSSAAPDLIEVMGALPGVSVLVWLTGEDRFATLLEHIVDTPCRGVVYLANADDDPGVALARRAAEAYRMPVETVRDPQAAATAVSSVLTG